LNICIADLLCQSLIRFLSDLRLGLGKGNYLGKSHQKLAITAEYLDGDSKDKTRHDNGPSSMTNCFVKRR
jgi:hypothetical protein